MSPGIAVLIAELVKIALQRLQNSGKFNTLTEDEAKAMALKIGQALSILLPTPEELEAGPGA